MLNKTLNHAYQEHILSLFVNPIKKGKMKKVVLEVKMTLEYPPHEKSKQYKNRATSPKVQC